MQHGVNNGVFGLLASYLDRFIVILEKDIEFCNKLPQFLRNEADRLNREKATVQEIE